MALDLARLLCPDCGHSFLEYRRTGVLGCASDYETFAVGLRPLLEKAKQIGPHCGKRPSRSVTLASQAQQTRQLRRQLRDAIAEERYEEAGRLRQQLAAKDTRNDD